MLKQSALALSAALALAGTSAFASVALPQGSTVIPDAGTFGGKLLIGTGTQTVTGQTTFQGIYVENVYSDTTGSNPYCSGCLDFIYQVRNTSDASITPTQIIESMTSGNFDSYQVSASYAPDPANVKPIDVRRSPTGGVITYDFLLLPGQASVGLILYTNALNYQLGTISLQDGTAGNGPVAYVPAGTPYSPVPEPSSLLLLGSGLAGVAGIGRRKVASFLKK